MRETFWHLILITTLDKYATKSKRNKRFNFKGNNTLKVLQCKVGIFMLDQPCTQNVWLIKFSFKQFLFILYSISRINSINYLMNINSRKSRIEFNILKWHVPGFVHDFTRWMLVDVHNGAECFSIFHWDFSSWGHACKGL